MPVPVFTAGEVLTASAMDSIGLWLVKTQTLNAVTNDITSCFSGNFDSYRVVISNFNIASGATVRAINMQMLNGTTPNASAQYTTMYNFAYPTNIGGNTAQAGVTYYEITLMSNRAGQYLTIDFNSPFLNQPSSISYRSISYQGDIAQYILRDGGGGHNVTGVFDGFRLYSAADALSGTVRVYGYRD